MKTQIVGLVVVVMSLTGSEIASALGASQIMPDELIAYATKNGCQPVGDFFKRPGMVNPSFVSVLCLRLPPWTRRGQRRNVVPDQTRRGAKVSVAHDDQEAQR